MWTWTLLNLFVPVKPMVSIHLRGFENQTL